MFLASGNNDREEEPLVFKQADGADGADRVGGGRRNEGKHLLIILDLQPDGSLHSPGDVKGALHLHLSILRL